MEAYLLVNLGTPETPTTPDVRKYLGEFLMDRDVIDLPWLARFLLVYGIIVPFRSPKSAKAYQKIWQDEGSPLMIHSKNFMEKLERAMPEDFLLFCCRYGSPSLEKSLRTLKDRGVTKLHIFPLYPQYAVSTWTTLEKKVQSLLTKLNFTPQLTYPEPFWGHSAFIKSYSRKLESFLAPHEDYHCLFSFHGLPEALCRKPVENLDCAFNDSCCKIAQSEKKLCYRAHCLGTAEKIAEDLNLPREKWTMSFQSRLGRSEWLKPYTSDTIENLAKKGVKNIVVLCPAFVVDCLETLEEIDIILRQRFIEAGGENFHMLPCLNDDDIWVDATKKMLLEMTE